MSINIAYFRVRGRSVVGLRDQGTMLASEVGQRLNDSLLSWKWERFSIKHLLAAMFAVVLIPRLLLPASLEILWTLI